jgi:penicillin-binding protein 1A
VWVGYDSRESLGNKETGAVTALPIWINFMRAAIVGKDDETFPGDQETAPPSTAANLPPAKLPLPAAAPKAALPARRQAPLVKPALAPAKKPAAKPAMKAKIKPAFPSKP